MIRDDQARQDAGDIYSAAAKRVSITGSVIETDLLIVECMLRAVLEVMTPEQRQQILEKVRGYQ